jgi:phosphocarrier protein
MAPGDIRVALPVPPVSKPASMQWSGDLGLLIFPPMSNAVREIVVQNTLGVHARPAMQFVDVANRFASVVTVKKGGPEPGEADGKSIMQMIILAATQGTPLRIEAEGEDAEQAVTELADLVSKKFGEED